MLPCLRDSITNSVTLVETGITELSKQYYNEIPISQKPGRNVQVVRSHMIHKVVQSIDKITE